MSELGNGGASYNQFSAGLRALTPNRKAAAPGILGYTAATHGVVDSCAPTPTPLASHRIRCNTVHTSSCNRPIGVKRGLFKSFVAENPRAGLDSRTRFRRDYRRERTSRRRAIFLCSARASTSLVSPSRCMPDGPTGDDYDSQGDRATQPGSDRHGTVGVARGGGEWRSG